MPLLLLASCSQDEAAVTANEAVTVTFGAELPRPLETTPGTRGETYTQVVDKVVCAVFKDGVEIETLRETFDATGAVTYAPRLAMEQNYDVVFFAYKEGAYEVSNLKRIVRKEGATLDEKYFEAFGATQNVTVVRGMTRTVTLKRVVAKITIGVTEDDLTAATTLGMAPTATALTVTGGFKTYNALTAQPTTEGEQSFIPEADLLAFTAGEKGYRRLGQCYFFTDGGNVDLTCDFKAGDRSIRGSVLAVSGLPVGRNQWTSLGGNLMTGTVTYSVSFGAAFEAEENEEI